MRRMLAERCAEWDAATKETRLLLSEQSNAKARFGCKLFRTLTRQHCTSLSMTTPHRTPKQSTQMKCPLIGELKIPTLSTSGLTTLPKNGLLVTFTRTELKASG